MGRNLMAQIAEYLSSHRRRKIGYWVLCSLGAVVVFCTTYALILPAITMSNEPICGMEAHTHDASCWTLETLAPETELICEEEWRDADVVFHTHSDLCYNAEGGLICPLEERERHVHDESCYVEQRTLICVETAGEAEEPGAEDAGPRTYAPVRAPHVHTDKCYRFERGELICPLEEKEGHRHDETLCYTDTPTGERILICDKPEFELVQVPVPAPADAVYSPDGGEDPAVQQPTVTYQEELQQVHWHDDSCYMMEMRHDLTCPLPEEEGHTHTDECYTWEQVLTCPETETAGEPETPPQETPEIPGAAETPEESVSGHVHTDECYEITPVLVCGEEELELHTHGPECYETITVEDEMGNLVDQEVLRCQLPVVIEHQHTEACVVQLEGEDQEVMLRTCGKTVHVHDDSCFVDIGPEVDPYFCGLAEHFHTADCYFESGELRCTIPEHTHTEECLDRDNFPDPEYPMEKPGETGMYTCGLTEHWHTDMCWSEDGELICLLEEHVHDESCLPDSGQDSQPGEPGESGEPGENMYICGLTEHQHTNECWSEDGELICLLEEHFHSESCLPGSGQDGQPGTSLDPVQINEEYEVPLDGFVMTFHIDGIALPVPEESGGVENDRNETAVPPLFQDVVTDFRPVQDAGSDSVMPPAGDPLPAVPESQQPEAQQPDPESQQPETQTPPADVPPVQTNDLSEEDGETIEDEQPARSGRLLSMNPESAPLPALAEEIEPEVTLPQPPAEDEPAVPAVPASDPDPWQPSPVQQEEEITFDLVEVTEGEEYEALMNQVRETVDEDELIIPAQVMEVVAYRGGQKLDLSNCEITVDLKPTQELIDALEGQQAAAISLLGGEESGEPAADITEPAETAPEDPENAQTYSVSVDFFTEGEAVQNQIMDTETLKSGANAMQFSIKRGARFARAAKFTPNPKYKVQFYVNIDVPLSDDKIDDKYSLPFIDTSSAGNGGESAVLPQNGNLNLKEKYLNLKTDDSGAVDFKKELRELYLPDEREFNPKLEDQLNINYLNSLRSNDHYSMTAVWVLKEGKDSNSTDEADWDIRRGTLETLNGQLKFTNNADAAAADTSGNTILINQSGETVIRLVYEANTGSRFVDDVAFYDYDISNGLYEEKDGVQYIDARNAGINTGEKVTTKLAFGNSEMNVQTGYGDLTMSNGQTPNKANNANYNGCTFKLAADSLDANGNIVFNLPAPDLFTNAEQKGKTGVPSINQLQFSRQGDTYTLSSVTGTNAKNLENFSFQRDNWSKTRKIWSNNFWPMDSAPEWGTAGHDIKFGDVNKANTRKFVMSLNEDGSVEKSGKLPTSDFGDIPGGPSADHNAYFGMHFAVDFTLIREYIGPLEYYFYGDDDMWVYLTYPDGHSKLICDIGGVHSSVGEYADLWDYIDKDESGSTAGTYRLSFFYTERGASGSTCWMQFTLPQLNLVNITPPYDKEAAGLRLEKKVESAPSEDMKDLEFRFEITLEGVINLYTMNFYNADGSLKSTDTISGDAFTNKKQLVLKHGEAVEIMGLPPGTLYTIEELYDENNRYHTHIDNNGTYVSGVLAKGEITGVKQDSAEEMLVNTAKVVYTNSFEYTLPETGGPSSLMYTTSGALLVTAAAGLLYSKRSKRREGC